MAKGTLRAISGETYGIFDGKEVIKEFRVKSAKRRKKVDVLQGQKVDFKKDIAPFVR